MPCTCRVEATPLDRRLLAMSSIRKIDDKSDYDDQNNDRNSGDNEKLISLHQLLCHVLALFKRNVDVVKCSLKSHFY